MIRVAKRVSSKTFSSIVTPPKDNDRIIQIVSEWKAKFTTIQRRSMGLIYPRTSGFQMDSHLESIPKFGFERWEARAQSWPNSFGSLVHMVHCTSSVTLGKESSQVGLSGWNVVASPWTHRIRNTSIRTWLGLSLSVVRFCRP